MTLTDEQLLTEADALDEAYTDATGPAEAYEKDLLALAAAARALVDNRNPALAPQFEFELRRALEQFEPWLEEDEDPRSMGWVDDRGRP